MMLIKFRSESAECHKAMAVNCERKGHIILYLIHADVRYYKKCANCVQDQRRKISEERKAKEKARKEQEEVEKWSLCNVAKARKKPKELESDAVSQPFNTKYKSHQLTILILQPAPVDSPINP